jgi:hypothetical protein
VKRHRFDPVSFIWGLFFVGLGLAFLTDSVQPNIVGLRAFWPLAIVALGLATLSSMRRRRGSAEESAPLDNASDHS